MNLKAIANSTKRNTHPVLSGLIYSFVITLGFVLIYSFLLYFTSLSDSHLSRLTYIITAISLSSGGFVSGKRAGQKGWYYGGITGIIYGLILAIIAFLAFDAGFNLNGLALITLTFLFGSLGGMFGVNTSKKSWIFSNRLRYNLSQIQQYLPLS